MADLDAFASAYSRLSAARLAMPAGAPRRSGDGPPSQQLSPAKPRSRLLERLALMAPTRGKAPASYTKPL